MPKGRGFLESLIKPFGLSLSSSNGSCHKEEDLEAIASREQKMFPYSVLAAATQNFNLKNKLGEGGYGPVYKGKLADGREVAVKKLGSGSRQGMKEFMNEAMLLSRVQHRNIVNLYGYCITGEDDSNGQRQGKLLVYEYIHRESLDKILFKKKDELDWQKRFDIISGVARGLLYLHEDSHVTIIHRDIKASNILLDDKWVPKIADFGMARLYQEDETHVKTGIVGTNGYMAPEYVMCGHLSTKADVYSYGVLILELISGQKNSTFIPPDAQCLLEWAWRLQKKGEILEIMDKNIKATAPADQVAFCAHIGLLCVQADPQLRPDMRRVVVMLSRKPSSMPEPARPGFSGMRYGRSYDPSGSVVTGASSSQTTSRSTSASASRTATAPLSTTPIRGSRSKPHSQGVSSTKR